MARTGLPFALSWWSFTFPIGTCVTGLTALAGRTGSASFEIAAAPAYAGLIGARANVALRTLGGVRSGALLAAPTG